MRFTLKLLLLLFNTATSLNPIIPTGTNSLSQSTYLGSSLSQSHISDSIQISNDISSFQRSLEWFHHSQDDLVSSSKFASLRTFIVARWPGVIFQIRFSANFIVAHLMTSTHITLQPERYVLSDSEHSISQLPQAMFISKLMIRRTRKSSVYLVSSPSWFNDSSYPKEFGIPGTITQLMSQTSQNSDVSETVQYTCQNQHKIQLGQPSYSMR